MRHGKDDPLLRQGRRGASAAPVLLALGLGSLASTPLLAQDNVETAPLAEHRTFIQAPKDRGAHSAEQNDAVDVAPLKEGLARGDALVRVPVTKIFPDGVRPRPELGDLPVGGNKSVWRGFGYFNQFNCIGCHAPNGAGGMGPSLSNASFKYGDDPENIFLTILQGRPMGMPAFGAILQEQVIWDLVSYVRAISRDDTGEWGRTTSLDAFTIEQVPAQYETSVNPWAHTQPFSFGQPPFEKVEPPTKREGGSP